MEVSGTWKIYKISSTLHSNIVNRKCGFIQSLFPIWESKFDSKIGKIGFSKIGLSY